MHMCVYLCVKGEGIEVLLILSWIATSTNEVGFYAGSYSLITFLSTARYTLCSWVGWRSVSKVICSRKHNHWCCLTFPNQYSWLNWSNVGLHKEITTTNSIIWGLNQDLLDQTPSLNHCCCYPTVHVCACIHACRCIECDNNAYDITLYYYTTGNYHFILTKVFAVNG